MKNNYEYFVEKMKKIKIRNDGATCPYCGHYNEEWELALTKHPRQVKTRVSSAAQDLNEYYPDIAAKELFADSNKKEYSTKLETTGHYFNCNECGKEFIVDIVSKMNVQFDRTKLKRKKAT